METGYSCKFSYIWRYKIFRVNGKYGIQNEFRIFHLHEIFYSAATVQPYNRTIFVSTARY